MKQIHKRFRHPAELRRLAEARLLEKEKLSGNSNDRSEADLRRLQHELEVHQIELEMQNEALVEAQAATEEALERSIDLFDFAPTGYFNLSADGTILAVNLAGARLAGVERTRLLKRPFAGLLSSKDRDDFHVFLARIFRGGGRGTFEGEFSSGGTVPIQIQIEAVVSADGTEARATVFDVTERHETEVERGQLIVKLQEALEQVKQLSGLLPICASCKKIRNDDGYWSQIEGYIADHSEATFTHGICPDCFSKALEDAGQDSPLRS
jgi:PAS domain S-box-containing protein